MAEIAQRKNQISHNNKKTDALEELAHDNLLLKKDAGELANKYATLENKYIELEQINSTLAMENIATE